MTCLRKAAAWAVLAIATGAVLESGYGGEARRIPLTGAATLAGIGAVIWARNVLTEGQADVVAAE